MFKVWYPFVSTMIELNVFTLTSTTGSSNASPTSAPPRLEPPSPAATVKISYKEAATRSPPARHSPAKPARTGRTASAKGTVARAATSQRASSAAAGKPPVVGATAAVALRAITNTPASAPVAAATTPPAAPSRLERVEGLLEMDIPRPMDTVKHLPVFESLCKGETLAPPDNLALPGGSFALGHGAASAGGAGGDGEREREGERDSYFLCVRRNLTERQLFFPEYSSSGYRGNIRGFARFVDGWNDQRLDGKPSYDPTVTKMQALPPDPPSRSKGW